MDKLKVLVLGVGFFGKNWLREVSACPGCELVGVVAKHPDLLAAVGDEFNIPHSCRFGTIDEGLDRSGAQAVIVTLPEMFHKEAILATLGRGLHVLTEKPLAMTMAEAAEIVRAVRRAKGATLMVDQNYRWRPHNQALRRAVREGKIGQVVSVGYEFRQNISRATTDSWRERMPHPFLHDMAIHHFDLLRATTGLDCREVIAAGVRPAWSMYKGVPGVDAIFTFDGGLRANYTGTMVARGLSTPQDGIITLMGEKGVLRLEADSRVRYYDDTGTPEMIPPPAMSFTDVAYALREFLAAIQEGRDPETHVEDNIRTLAIVEAAITSIETAMGVAVAPLVETALRQ